MDFAHRYNRLILSLGFSKRIPALSGHLEKAFRPFRNPKIHKWALIFALFLFSIFLGGIAQNASQKEAIESWLDEHPPSPAIWKTALQSGGYEFVSDPKMGTRLIRSIPIQMDEGRSVWISQDECWIALPESKNGEIPKQLYRRNCETSPADWKSLGPGWIALEVFLSSVSRPIHQAKRAIVPKKIEFRDPREIRY